MSLSTLAKSTCTRTAFRYSTSLVRSSNRPLATFTAIRQLAPGSNIHRSRFHQNWNSSSLASLSFSSSATTGDRPFRVLGIQQIAIGSTEREPLNNLWENIFGLKPSPIHRLEKENVEECIIKLGPQNQNSKFDIEIDLMTPINPDVAPKVRVNRSVVKILLYVRIHLIGSCRSLDIFIFCCLILNLLILNKVHVPPLNHIGLWVDDLESAVDWMKQQGVRFTPGGIRKGAAGHNVTFIHPKGNENSPIGGNGVLIELVQAPDDIIGAYTS